MQITTDDTGTARIVAVLEDRIDAANAVIFKDTMGGAATDAPGRVVLDLSAVEFIDSSGLGSIVAVMKQLAPERSLELAGLNDTVAKVFRLTRMDSVFTIHPDQAAATGLHQHAS